MITILTATYNREKLLPDLYHSLLRQTSKEFVWVVVDDGSSDGTKALIESWINSPKTFFRIVYIYQENGGRNRAINTGIKSVDTDFTCFVDSDDYLTDDAIEFFNSKIIEINTQNNIVGISGLKGYSKEKSLNTFSENYIIASNIQRSLYGLEKDCCEVYKTIILKKHPFPVWPGEKFTPEAVVWNEIALEGYSIMWYNKVVCIIRYLEDGLTKGSWNLLKKNPMGYAMMFNHQLKVGRKTENHIKFGQRVNIVLQFISCCCLAKEYKYLFECHSSWVYPLFPLGWILSQRRKKQFKEFVQ